MRLDFWYGNNLNDIKKINIYFNDSNGTYFGNMYINEKIVGDFTADSWEEIENTFNRLHFNW